ncbi:MAG: hypothetical protein ACI4PG_09485 [Candidatus Ventricola sp.]
MRSEKLRAVLADPLRVLLTARPGTGARLGLLAVLAAVYAAALLYLCAAMEGAPVIAAAGTLSMLLVTGFAWRALRGEHPEAMVLLCTGLLAMLAVGAHVALLDIKPGRYTGVLAPMLGDMWNYDLLTAMAWEEGSWSGGYLIVMALVSRLEHFSALYALKLVDLLCLCLASGAVLRLAQLRGATARGAVAAMMACLLAPTMLMNAGLWLHCDALFAMLTLWGLALLLDEHPLAGCVLLGLALATKLQSAFVFPLLIVLFVRNRVQLRHLLALAAAALFSQAAILLDGQGLAALVGRYAMQLEEARGTIGLADSAPGVYGLMKVASVREFSGMGLYFGMACALLVVLALLRARRPLDNETLLLGALLLACGLPLVLPQMNARSLYLAGLLAFALAGSARRMAAAGLLELLSLCAYMRAIFGHEMMPMAVLSLLAIAAAVLVLTELLPALCGRDKGATRA